MLNKQSKVQSIVVHIIAAALHVVPSDEGSVQFTVLGELSPGGAKTTITNFKAVSRQDGNELLQILDRAGQWGGEGQLWALQHVLERIWQLAVGIWIFECYDVFRPQKLVFFIIKNYFLFLAYQQEKTERETEHRK